ncbi:MAG: site-specific DNA-methyltransferase, partial [Planctomycetota bacterium]|nr:site-specific DNA-methyltransferase [Planctomycetota bacterium]
MSDRLTRNAPGRVRDAILEILARSPKPLPVKEIVDRVSQAIGHTPDSSIRSYLRLNTPGKFVREDRGSYRLREEVTPAQVRIKGSGEIQAPFCFGKARLFHGDCFKWIGQQPDSSIHAVLTDPPYGLHEYTAE